MAAPDEPHVIDDPDAPPSEEELASSARLRDALEDPAKPSAEAELLRAVSLAHAPRELAADEHRVIVERALTRVSPARALRGRVIRVAFGVGGALALAAGVALIVRSGERVAPPGAELARVELARPRSTQPLFREPFAREARASMRIDRIASARSSDLRENRFRRWGVR